MHIHSYGEEYEYDQTNHWQICDICDEIGNIEKHSFVSVTTQPTLESGGYTEYTCSVCGYSYQDDFVPAITLEFDSAWSVDETKGTHYHACVTPGHEDRRQSEDSHHYQEKTIAPTYDSIGYTEYTCSVCGYSYQDDFVDMLEHHYDSAWSVDEAKGTHYHACVDEGFKTERGDEAPHSFATTTIPPTYETDGFDRHVCTVCGYVYGDNVVPRLVHQYAEAWSIDEIQGTHYHACLDEGFETERSDEGPHDYGDWVIDNPPTQTESGTRYRECSVCGHRIEETIAPLAEQYLTFEYDENKEGYVVVSCAQNAPEIEIPSTYRGEPVVAIGSYAFKECRLTKVIVPASVEIIYEGAFYWCDLLESVTLPAGLTAIPDKAFYCCHALKELNIPQKLESIGVYAFDCCYSLPSFTIPATVHTIKQAAFEYCTSFVTVEIPDTVVSFGPAMFMGCSSLKEAKLPSHLTAIPWSTFANCTSLVSYTVPNGIKTIEHSAFSACSGLVSVSLPEGLQTIEEWVFAKNPFGDEAMALKEINFPSTLKSIGEDAFYGCAQLVDLVLPEGVTTLGASAFMYCTSLATVKLPSSLQRIEPYVFAYCPSLRQIVIPSSITYLHDAAFINSPNLLLVINASDCDFPLTHAHVTKNVGATLCLEEGDVWVVHDEAQHIASAYVGKGSELVIPSMVTEITAYAFAGNTTIATVKLPASLQRIGNEAFADCSSLVYESYDRYPGKYIGGGALLIEAVDDIENYLVHPDCRFIYQGAFAGKTVTKTLILPENLVSIGDEAFAQSGLVSLMIPASVVSIGAAIFEECNALTEVTIPFVGSSLRETKTLAYFFAKESYAITESHSSTLRRVHIVGPCAVIGPSAFSNWTGLTEIAFDAPILSIGSGAFSNCSGLTSMDLPKTLAELGEDAFAATLLDTLTTYGCFAAIKGAAVHVTLKGDMTEIPDSAFARDEHILTLNILAPIVSIGKEAFYGSHIASISLPDTLTSIGERAFIYSDLASIRIPDSVTGIGQEAFAYCSSLFEVTLPAKMTALPYRLFFAAGLSEISLPESLLEIGEEVFAYSRIVSLTIPTGVVSIGKGILKENTVIESLTTPFVGSGKDDRTGLEYVFGGDAEILRSMIPASLKCVVVTGKTIQPYAFYRCATLPRVEAPNAVSVGDYAFYGCSALGTFIASKALQEIGSYAFVRCNFQHLVIPEAVTYIGPSAYEWNPVSSIEFPATLTYLGDYAFSYCTRLERVELPSSLRYIGFGALANCSIANLTLPFLGESLDSPGPLKHIFGNAEVIYWSSPNNCYSSALVFVSINGKAKELVDFAFHGFPALESITLTDSIEKIGKEAFAFLPRLLRITLPSGLTSLGDGVFSGCDRLVQVIFPSVVPSLQENIFNDGYRFLTEIVYPVEHEFGYGRRISSLEESTLTFASYGVLSGSLLILGHGGYLEEGFTEIGPYAFLGCSMDKITIPASVKRIDEWAFYGCSNLKEIAFAENSSLLFVDDNAFSGLKDLSYYVEDEIRYIGSASNPYLLCFGFDGEGTSDDGTITIHDECRFIVAHAFEGRDWLVLGAPLPESLFQIGAYAFASCHDWDELVLPRYVSYVGTGAFSGTAIASMTTRTPVSGDAFDVAHLRHLTFTGATLEERGFASFTGLESVDLPNVTAIPAYAFTWCSSLYEVNFGSYLSSIGAYAFASCRIFDITLPKSLQTIGEDAFSGNPLPEIVNLSSLPLEAGSEDYGCVAYNAVSIVDDPEAKRGHFVDDFFMLGTELFAYVGLAEYVDVPLCTRVYANCFPNWIKGIYFSEGEILFDVNSMNHLYNLELNNYGGGGYVGTRGNPYKYLVKAENTDITELTVHNRGCEQILPYAFYQCRSLATVDFGLVLRRIEVGAFQWCSSLSSIDVPSTVYWIGEGAFDGCPLSHIGVPFIGNAENMGSFDSIFGVPSGNDVEIVLGEGAHTVLPLGRIAPYVTRLELPSTLVSIPEGVFSDCSKLEELTIPVSVTTIGQNSLPSSLKRITMPYVKSSGSCPDALSYYGNLASLEYVELTSVTGGVIPASSFRNDKALREVVLPETGVTTIGAYAFAGCSSLYKITLPASLLIIETDAFAGCDSLIYIINPSSLKLEAGTTKHGQIALHAIYIGPEPLEDESVFYQ